jgi:hypothetical protein
MADVNFVDGQQLEPYYFGNNDANGVWKPIKYTGMYGTNGFYLTFADTSALTTSSNVGLGKDTSGNGNYWTTNNISITAGTTYDAMTDVPTNTSATVANYAVMNPLDKGTSITLQDGNLTQTIGATHNGIRGTFQIPTSGKWYWEVTIGSTTSNSVITAFGLATASSSLNTYAYNTTGTYCIYAQGSPALLYITNGSSGTSFGSAISAGTVCGIAYDADNGQLYLAIANTYYNSSGSGTGNPAGGTNSSMAVSASLGLFPYVQTYSNTNYINFGQRPFSYTPPSGFVALNTFNLPTPTILQGNKYMDATLYTGNGSGLTVVNAGQFKPDFVWVKSRSVGGNPVLVDSVRGANKVLYSPQRTAEETPTVGTAILSFNSNGFSLGGDISGTSWGSTNGNTFTYVGWQWQAGQGSTSSNTSGSITSTTSVSTTAGFSVVTYTGTGSAATIGHGLGVAPKMIICKSRGATGDWVTYHTSIGAGNALFLNLTDASAATTAAWNNTAPTPSVFSVAASTNSNPSGVTCVAYCWAEIAGFSAFGSYTGNGSANGPMIYLGFQPKFVMFKDTTNAQPWYMWDASRNTSNSITRILNANNSNAEGIGSSGEYLDFLSNGFKLRSDAASLNNSGDNYIYMAFASNPFKNSNSF